MFSKVQLHGFKSISNNDPIQLKPFTILCGSNSSGKSSLIQSILMLSQSLSSRYSQGSILLNGHLTKLGSFTDIAGDKKNLNRISVSYKIDIKSRRRIDSGIVGIELRLVFGKITNGALKDDELHPELIEATISVDRMAGNEKISDKLEIGPLDRENQIEFDKLGIGPLYKVREIKSQYDDYLAKNFPEYTILGCVKNTITPYVIYIEYNYTKKISSNIIALMNGTNSGGGQGFVESIGRDLEMSFPIKLIKKLREIISNEKIKLIEEMNFPDTVLKKLKINKLNIDAFKKQLVDSNFVLNASVLNSQLLEYECTTFVDWRRFLGGLESKTKENLIEIMDKYRTELQSVWYEEAKKERRVEAYSMRSFFSAFQYLNNYLPSSIKYLGPLRIEPLAIYPNIGLLEPANVGLKGEYSAAVWHNNRYKIITHYKPNIEADGSIKTTEMKTPLPVACIDWLSYLGVISNVKTTDKGKFGYEIFVKTSDSDGWQDLTHVGVGVSQVLPIVLMSLLSEEDDVLIFEQPELHLHPMVQSRLCDFFIAMSLAGRQCLIETHSEYLINRLRLRIAESRLDDLVSKGAIFFINKVEGVSEFKSVDVNMYGAIVDWPTNFFDQADAEVERILMEAGRKRREQNELQRKEPK